MLNLPKQRKKWMHEGGESTSMKRIYNIVAIETSNSVAPRTLNILCQRTSFSNNGRAALAFHMKFYFCHMTTTKANVNIQCGSGSGSSTSNSIPFQLMISIQLWSELANQSANSWLVVKFSFLVFLLLVPLLHIHSEMYISGDLNQWLVG